MVFWFEKIILGIFFVFFAHPSFAQMFYFRDSLEVIQLEKKLINASGLEKIDIKNQIAATSVHFNPERAFKISKLTLSESDKIFYKKGKAFATSNIGFYFFLQNDFIKAYLYQIQALNIIEKEENRELEMLIHERIGYIYYFSQAEMQQIINYFDILIKYYDGRGNKNRAASFLVAQGGGSFRAGKYIESFNYFNRFLEYTKDLNIPRIEKLIVYYSLGDIYFIRSDLKNAWKYYKKCLELDDVRFIEEVALVANICLKVGDFYNHINKTDSAIYFYNRCLRLSDSIYYARGLMKANNSLGKLFKTTGEFEKAVTYFNDGYQNGLKIDSLGAFFFHPQFDHLIDVTDETWMSSPKEFKKYFGKQGIVEALTNIIILDKKNSSQKNIAYKLNKLLSLKDSILDYQIRREVIELGLKYETEKKEQQILLLQNENDLQKSRSKQTFIFGLGIIGFIVIVLFLIIIYLRQNRLKVAHERTIFQQKLLRSQMNPHFIFNSLASLQNTILNNEPEKASKYLARFSRIMRNILYSSVDEFITLGEEISTIENYLALQKIRFPEKFDYMLEVDEKIDTDSIFIPPMMAQPFIENAIEHGVKHRKSKGNIHVRFAQVHDTLIYEVEDDGVGREVSQQINRKQNSDHKSLAIDITMERVKVFNKKKKKKIKLEIIDLKDNRGEASGTLVRFNFPKD